MRRASAGREVGRAFYERRVRRRSNDAADLFFFFFFFFSYFILVIWGRGGLFLDGLGWVSVSVRVVVPACLACLACLASVLGPAPGTVSTDPARGSPSRFRPALVAPSAAAPELAGRWPSRPARFMAAVGRTAARFRPSSRRKPMFAVRC